MCTFKAMLKQIAFVAVLGTAAVVYTGCGKDYDDDFKKMEEKVDGNQTDLQQLLQDRVSQINAQLATLETAHKEMVDGAKKEAISTAADALKGARDEFAANVADLQGKIDANKGEIDSKLAAEINNLKTYTDSEILKIAAQIAAIDASLDQLDGRTAKLENGVEALNEKLTLTNKTIDQLIADLKTVPDKIDAARKEAMEKAASDLKAARDQANADIALVNANLNALQQMVNDNNNKSEDARQKLSEQITSLNTTLTSAINGAVATLDAKITALGGRIDDQYKSFTDQVAAIDTKYTGISKELADLKNQYTTDMAAINTRMAAAEGNTLKIYQELLATITAKETALNNEIDKLNTAFLSQAALYDQKLQTQYEKITREYSAALEPIKERLQQLEGRVGALEQTVAELIDYKNKLNAEIVKFKEELKKEEADLAEAIRKGDNENAEAIRNNVTAISDVVKNLEQFEQQYATDLTNLNDKISSLNQAVKDNNTDVKQYIDAAITALTATVTNNFMAQTELSARVSDMQSQINQTNTNVGDITRLVSGLQSYFNDFVDETQEAVMAIFDDLDDLDSKIDGVDFRLEELKAQVTGIVSEIATIQSDLTALSTNLGTVEGRVTTLESDLAAAQSNIVALQASKADQTALAAAIVDMEKIAEDLAAAKTEAKAAIDAYKEAIETYKTEIDASFQNVYSYLGLTYYTKGDIDGQMSDVKTLINDNVVILQNKITAADTRITNLSNTLTPRIDALSQSVTDLNTRVTNVRELMLAGDAALKALIDAVSSRIQSVAYIPEYADGKVMVSSLGGNSGKASFQFKVTPAAASAEVVSEFTATPANFTVDVRDAKVRSGNATSLVVTAIEEVEPGVVKVTADPVGMVVGSVYKAALNIKLLNGTDLTSDYFTVEPTTINENLISFNYTGPLAENVTFVLKSDPTITGFSANSNPISIIFNTLNSDGSFATPQSLDFEVTGVDFAAYGLDASKVTIVPEIVSVYSWVIDKNILIAPVSGNSSTIAVANCLTFDTDGKIIPVAPNTILNADMSIYKCVVKLQAQYNGTNVGTPKYTCVKFQKPVL